MAIQSLASQTMVKNLLYSSPCGLHLYITGASKDLERHPSESFNCCYIAGQLKAAPAQISLEKCV